MKHWKRAMALGFLSWLIPLAGGFVAYPLKRVSPALFDTAMAVILVVTAALLARRFGPAEPQATLLLGESWVRRRV